MSQHKGCGSVQNLTVMDSVTLLPPLFRCPLYHSFLQSRGSFLLDFREK